MESLKRLIKRLDDLCSRERDRAVASWAREARSQDIDAALEDLGRGDAWHRRLAVLVGSLAGRAEIALRALEDPSLLVRRAASAQVAGRCRSPAAIVDAAMKASPGTRMALARMVSRLRRRDLAQPLVEALLGVNDMRAARPLLEWCDGVLLGRVVAARGVKAVRWARTARFQPELTLDVLKAELGRAGSDAAAAWAWRPFAGALKTLVHSHPHRLLDLWETFGPRGASPFPERGCWPELLRADAARTAALLGRTIGSSTAQPTRRTLPRPFLRRVAALSQPALARVAQALAANPAGLAMLLEKLPPSRRENTFRAALKGVDATGAIWPDALMAALPHAVRHAEARRMLGLAQVQGDPEWRLALTAWLPLDEASALTVETHAGKGEERARAWTLRVACASSNRRGVAELLESLLTLKNEQDPVRLAAYGALARVPIRLFEPAHAAALLELTTFAVKARDTSAGTRTGLRQLAQRLLVAWAHEPSSQLFQTGLQIMLLLAEHRPVLAFPGLARGLRRGAERALVDALLPWFRKEVAREVNANVLQLAGALGERARHLQDLQKLLESIVFTSRPYDGGERARAVALWLDDPKERDARVRKILDWDESAVMLHPVWRHLHLRRQDWLDPFLRGCVLKGRFGSTKAGWVFPAQSGFGAWLPRQQRAFGLTLRVVLDDTGHHVATRAAVLRVLASLSVTTCEDLLPLTRHAEVPICEAALGALVWLDARASALPVLLDHLDSDRARVAMYAMPRMVRFMPDTALLAALREILARPKLKLTVHKEAIRLLGGVWLPGAAELLGEQWSGDGLHRDLRVALLHAARRRLDDPGSWAMLESAALYPEREVARSLLESALADVDPPHRPRYATLLVRLARHPSVEVRKALMAQLGLKTGWGTVAPAEAAVAASEVVLAPVLDAPWREATSALAALSVQPQASAVVVETIARLVKRACTDPLVVASEQEDMPAQRRLTALCAALASVAPADRGATAGARAGALQKTSTLEAWLWSERVELTLADLPIGVAAATALRELAAHAPAELGGGTLAPAVTQWSKDQSRPCESKEMLELADVLLDAQANWPALGVVIAAGERFGWGHEARTRLATLRERPQTEAQARRVRVA